MKTHTMLTRNARAVFNRLSIIPESSRTADILART